MLDKNEVKVAVDNIRLFDDGIVIEWSGNLGFGEYTIYKDDKETWHVDSERMDSIDDMWFLKLLINDLLTGIENKISTVE